MKKLQDYRCERVLPGQYCCFFEADYKISAFRVLQLFVFPVAAFLLEPVGGVQKSFSSEGFEKQCNRPEFKWVQAPAYRWLRTQPDTPFNSSEPALFSL